MIKGQFSLNEIVHLTSVHTYEDTRIFYKELHTLRQAGFFVVLIAPAIENQVVADIKIIGIKKQKNRFLRMTLTAWQIYRLAIKEKADIYHFHDPELIWIGLLLKIKGYKVIYDSHENVSQQILSKEWLPKSTRKIVSYVFAVLEMMVSRYFDYIIAATPSIKKHFVKLGINKCVDVNNYPVLKESNIGGDAAAKIKNQICYVGGISKVRGIKQMILAIELLNDVRLVLAGDFTELELKKECSKLFGWGRVNELGFIDRNKTMKIMQSSIAGLVLFQPAPNHIEAQPNKLFEYMAAGIPVIASDFPLWRSIIVNNHCGICVNPFDVKGIAGAIKYIIDHPKDAEIMGDNGRRLVIEKFNWDNEAKKLIDVYKEVSACK
ncbi:MAG TPA: glycosyl transferase [Coxiellaceae bacterium]|nr:glycosyl transferase [Coxiellaceae bacterium]HBY55516.1 glycosyl transferase [Coxiellaceae bacterium]